MTIQFFDAFAGSGKTRCLAQYADQIAKRGENVLFVQPSLLLLDNTIETEIFPLVPRYSVSAIHNKTSDDVVKTIVARVNAEPVGHGQIIFITHEAFMRLPYLKNKAQWHLIFDEVPDIDHFKAFTIPDSHHQITDTIDMHVHDMAYGRLLPQNGSNTQLNKMARNVRCDQIWAQISGLASKITSPDWDVYVLQSNYCKFLANDKTCQQLFTFSLLRASVFDGFKQVIIASALIKESILYKLWSLQGVTMRSVDQCMHDKLRYQHHENGNLITINYVTDYEWSKSLRNRQFAVDGDIGKSSLLTALPGLIRDAQGTRRFAWMGNKDIADDYFGEADAVRLPNSPHGLNMFQDLHDVVILSALNPAPAHFHFMEAQGISGDELRSAHYRSAVYQAAMRISIRNPLDKTPKTITVMDLSTAEWLADLFPGASIQKLAGEIPVPILGRRGRPRLYASAKERTRAFRERKRQNLTSLDAVNGPFKHKMSGSMTEKSFGSSYSSIYDVNPALYLDVGNSDTFIKLIRNLHKRKVASKDDNFLFSPSYFDPDRPGVNTRRGHDNISYVNGIWLDNDGGDLTHAEFAKLFPTLRIVVWNTYSSTAKSERWRCFIPTTDVVTPDVYRALIAQIEIVLRNAGFVSKADLEKQDNKSASSMKCHGFDVGKFVASSLFYAPCQAKLPNDSFFNDYSGDMREPLNPYQMVRNDIRPVQIWENRIEKRSQGGARSTPNANASPTADHSLVDAALMKWRNTPKGHGNKSFFDLAVGLRRAGLSLQEIRPHLCREACTARSPHDRKADINGIMKSISRPIYSSGPTRSQGKLKTCVAPYVTC